jgi:hypothetical protein
MGKCSKSTSALKHIRDCACLIVISLCCLSSTAGAGYEDDKGISFEAYSLESILNYTRSFIGTPYKYGGCSPGGFDCSGLVQHVFLKHGIEMPHSSRTMYISSIKVDKQAVRAGDLVFFRGPGKGKGVGHVALVSAISQGVTNIIHATRRGIVEEILEDESYYMQRLIAFGRVVDFELINLLNSAQGESYRPPQTQFELPGNQVPSDVVSPEKPSPQDPGQDLLLLPEEMK